MSAHFSFLLSSRARNPKCSANNHQTVRWRASGFSAPNLPVRNNKSSSALDSSFAAWGRFPFASSKTSCFFLERRTSLDLRNSQSLRMFSLEFLSFRYRCRLLWNDCSVAGSYDTPSLFFITIRNWHIKMLSSSAGISSIFLASPTSRKNLFQTCRSYSVFFTVFFLHTRHRELSFLLVFFPLRTDIFFVTELFYLIRVIKLALTVVWVQDEINICRKKWKVYTISINLVNKKLQRRNWCNVITQRIGYRPLWAGRMGTILPALGTNQIARFVEYRPPMTWEKN